MRRGLVHVGVWAAATAVAVTLSWFGVHSVLRRTAYGPPRALRIAAQTQPPAISSATHSPKPVPKSPDPRRTPTSVPSSVPAPPQPPPGTPQATKTAADPGAGNVHGYTVAGGEVVLDLSATSASLVSATPNAGWKMQLWASQPGWLRVTFTSDSGTAASSVFCTWNGHPPTVQSYEN